jgi:hypothetical protein
VPNSPATTSASAPFADAPGDRPSQRATLIVCLAGGAILLAIASVRLLRDGSFWLDEASIAVNLIQQRPLELLGALETGHNFPRLYLISISVLMETFGYHTMLLRLLPFCAFVAGLAAWLRLGFVRFRSQPLMLALLLALSLIPGTWLAYAAMLKQYTMDVLVALGTSAAYGYSVVLVLTGAAAIADSDDEKTISRAKRIFFIVDSSKKMMCGIQIATCVFT